MRPLVTGGAGFIGSHIATALLDADHEVVVIDNLSSGKTENVPDGATLEKCDILSHDAAEIIADWRPEAIFHHAAQMDVRRSVANPGFDAETNVVGTVRVLEAARQAKCAFFQLASTGGAIYGDQEQRPPPEETAPSSDSPYGVSKLCGEHYVDYYGRTSELRGVSLRYGNVYGPRQDPHGEAGVVAIFAQRMLRGDAPTGVGDGKQTRDYIYVDDVVPAVFAAWQHPHARGAYNVGTGIETDVNRLAEVIKEACGFDGEIAYGDARKGEQRTSCGDITRARNQLGWEPKVSIEGGLPQTVEWFRQRLGG